MRSFSVGRWIVGSVCCAALASVAQGAIVASYTVGTGTQSSIVQFDFVTLGSAATNTYLYEVRHDAGLFGDDLFAIIAAEQPTNFAFEVITFSFGDALFSVGIGSDSASGFGTAPDYLDYWHYWTRESAVVSDGSWDGWVFNSGGAPVTVPAPGALALFALVGLRRARRTI